MFLLAYQQTKLILTMANFTCSTFVCLALIIVAANCENAPCMENKLNHCVCSEVYCDTISDVPIPKKGEILQVSTTKLKPGFRLKLLQKKVRRLGETMGCGSIQLTS